MNDHRTSDDPYAREELSPEARAYLEKMRDPRWYGDQDENGVDLSLIRANLKLTPEERLLRGDQGRRSALELLEYGRQRLQERSA